MDKQMIKEALINKYKYLGNGSNAFMRRATIQQDIRKTAKLVQKFCGTPEPRKFLSAVGIEENAF